MVVPFLGLVDLGFGSLPFLMAALASDVLTLVVFQESLAEILLDWEIFPKFCCEYFEFHYLMILLRSSGFGAVFALSIRLCYIQEKVSKTLAFV